MGKITCEICGVKTCRENNIKRIFMAKFPLNEERCKQWVKATGKEDLVYVPIEKLHQLKYICEKHFKNKDFKKKKTQLRRNAVPSIEISSTPLLDEMFIEFPLHINETEVKNILPAGRTHNDQLSATELLQIISQDHDYCCPATTSIPSKSTSDPNLINQKRKRLNSPEPSTSTLDAVSVDFKKKRPCSPKPSTSALDAVSVDFKNKRPNSPISARRLEFVPDMAIGSLPITLWTEYARPKVSALLRLCLPLRG